MGKFFENDNLIDVKASREDLFESFASAALEFSGKLDCEYEFSEDFCRNDTALFRDFADSAEGNKILVEIHSEGALDFFATFLQNTPSESEADEEWMEYNPPFDMNQIRSDLGDFGLHSLHFRMNLKDDQARHHGVTILSQKLHDYHSEAARNDLAYPLKTLSSLIREDYEHELRYATDAVHDFEDDPVHPFTKTELNELLCLCAHVKGEPEQPDALNSAMSKFITGRGEYTDEITNGVLPKPLLAKQIEDGLMAMVYNYGYRIKACYTVSNFDLKEEIDPIVDRLLAHFSSTPEFLAALKRQVMINLFSAFPKGLEMFDAKPEELQGVMLDPVLKSHPDAKYFLRTLMGPMALFGAAESAPEQYRSTQLIKYLAKAGYQISAGVASQGLLFDRPEFIGIIHHEQGASEALEAYWLEERPVGQSAFRVAKTLLRGDYLEHYHDRAIANLVAVGAHIMASGELLPHDFKAIFDQRPGLSSSVLDQLLSRDLLSPEVYKACGFGLKELRLLGNRAPESLAEFTLSGDLGL